MSSLEKDIEILTTQRDIITECDKKILSLLEERVEAARKIGHVKKKNNKPIYVPEIENKKIADLASLSQYPGLVEAIWPVIMCYTRTVE